MAWQIRSPESEQELPKAMSMKIKQGLNFTIPSIHDDTLLDCRIYHPLKFLHNGAVGETIWRKKGAIIAHPYAPLGGCYDDPVVQAVAVEILRKGFAVGLFNFRGAGDSKGRTSWTAKPEVSDYISFAGFFIHYLDNLTPPSLSRAPGHSPSQSDTTLTPIQSSLEIPIDHFDALNSGMVLILGGYSYGSMICRHLPNTEAILRHFANAVKGTAEAEIRLRALHLSTQWNKEASSMNEARRGRSLQISESCRGSPHSVSFGGDETEPGSRRQSRDSKRSLDNIRRSVDNSRTSLDIKAHSSGQVMKSPALEERLISEGMTVPQTYYLLISPLLPPVSLFATIFSKLGPHGLESQRVSKDGPVARCHGEEKLTIYTTLAIYGDKDFFTSQKKLRKWAEHLAGERRSRFRFREVAGAGHFWHEQGVEGQMRSAIRDWTQDILSAPWVGQSL